uniref:Putative glutathione S-transferase theta class member 1 n=1 Tax=Leptinotarsa decemlineata TaxID=7539 RepID=A0A1P8PEV3_LEPDE|nr:uncharacterized protein LOC111514171 [Leptinotarsa decemlineata]APX61051.1 putative glutathione S-transferase theta class member 1 [Leptinotarsa decemlineata]
MDSKRLYFQQQSFLIRIKKNRTPQSPNGSTRPDQNDMGDNQQCHDGNKVHKIEPLLKMFIKKRQEIYVPGKVVCIDESLIPFRGCLLIKHFLISEENNFKPDSIHDLARWSRRPLGRNSRRNSSENKIHPGGEVPSLLDGSNVLVQSLDIC